MRKHKLLAILLTLALVLTMLPSMALASDDPRMKGYRDGDGTGYAELPPTPDMSDSVINVTAANAQYVLDGAYGSIDGKTINFTENMTERLILGRPTKYAGSNTTYMYGELANPTACSYDDLINYKSQTGYTLGCVYKRTVHDVTFTASEGVVLSGFIAHGGYHVYGTASAPIYDYVRDKGVWCSDTNDGYYTSVILKNIKFSGLTLNGLTSISTSSPNTVYDNFIFENCTFNTGNTAANNQAIRYYNENNNGKVKNLTVQGCTFNNCFQGVYTNNVNGVTVTSSTFDTTGHNAIAVQSVNGAVNHKAITIIGNTFTNIGDRIIRFGVVGADTQITIANNTATNSGDKSGEVIKAASLANGISYNVYSNSWGDGKTVVNEQLKDKELVAEVNGVKYTSLAAAIAAAQTGDTVKLLKDVMCDSVIDITKSITLDGANHKISTTANRGIWINKSDVTVNLKDFVLEAGSGTERGVQVNVDVTGIKLSIDNCDISATMYGINVCNGAGVELSISNSTISAWGALNLWSAEYAVTVENSTLIGTNDKSYDAYGWNNFGTVVLEGDTTGQTEDHAELNTVTLNNCNIIAIVETEGNAQCVFLFNEQSENNKIYVNGVNTTVSSADNLCVDNGNGNQLLITGGTYSSAPTTYVAEGYIAKRVGSAEPYTYTVLAKANLTDGVYMSSTEGATAPYYYSSNNGDGTWTVYYVPPYVPPTTTNTETTTNPDGSTTTTTTDKTTGTVTETTTSTTTDAAAGTTTETKVETVTDAAGAVTSTETVKTTDSTGTTGTTTTTTNSAGQTTVTAEATVTTAAVAEAARNEVPVTLPVEVAATGSTATAPVVEIQVPATATEVKVEVPVENLTAGTVAVLVKPDGTEEIIKNTTMGENGVVVSLDGSATVKIVDNSKEFEDVHDADHWSESAVDFVSSREIFNGTSDTTFDPEVDMTRGMMATVLARYDGADTTGGENWYDKGVEWAKENEISDGTNPTGKLTREEMAVMLYRYAGSPDADGELDFPDAGDVSDYAAAAMRWAVENGLINGMDGKLNPKGFATRAQLAAILMRFCQNVAN